MSASATGLRWLVFLALFFVWPLPMLGLEGTVVPVARFAQLALALSVFVAIEGLGGMAGTLLVLLWGHVLVYGSVLFGVAWLIGRGVLARLPARVAVGVAVAAVAGLTGWAIFAPPYETLFHHSDAHASLLVLYR